MSKKWTEQEDRLLNQLLAIGLTAKVIYENYSEVLQSRTQQAIASRITYLVSLQKKDGKRIRTT